MSGMKLRTVVAVAAIATALCAMSARAARADEHGRRGDFDEHHGGTTPTGGTITIRDGSGSIIPNGPNAIASGASKMATGTKITTGATVTGGSTGTRNGLRSIIRIGSHGMTTGKTAITSMMIDPHPGCDKSSARIISATR
jgi:hypothetical protein